MKKFILLLLVVILPFTAIACSEGAEDLVSYKATAYLIGSSERFNLTVISGTRESPYLMDGERGDMVEFCTITLKPASGDVIQDSCTYEVYVGEDKYTGSLNKDTFGTTMSGDIGVDIGEDLTSVKIKIGEESEDIMLENMMANALISGEDAIEIARNALSDTLANLPEGDKREIYLKFVSDVTGRESVYYWYVAYVGEGGKYSAVLIDIVSGDIIAKRG